jgi:hypothetical protein
VEIWQDATNSHGVGVLIEDESAVSIDETEQADLTVFAEVWLKNIRVQQRIGGDAVIYSIFNRWDDRNPKIWRFHRCLLTKCK